MTDLVAPLLAAADVERPAGGAQLDQLAVLAVVNIGGALALLWLMRAHWSGRTKVLSLLAAGSGFVFRVPGWAALPVLVASISLLAVMFGGFWDIGYHIDVGRDEGPLGNAGHWPQMAGFFGAFAAGMLGIALARTETPRPGWVRLAPGWSAPVGSLLLIACGSFAMLALPLDDVWHRIFGQDVTLWSPTHFMLLAGGTFSIIGMAVLVAEGGRARRAKADARADGNGSNGHGPGPGQPWSTVELFGARAPWARVELFRGRELARRAGRAWGHAQKVLLLGGMLVGLEAFLAEFDWGVPLYRQVWQPLFLAAAAGFVFTAGRSWAGRGGALGTWGAYLVIRLAASLMPVLAGRSAALLPLFLVEALLVESVALRLSPRLRPLAFGALAGLACGTVGFAAEYGWSQIAMPLPWTEGLLAEGIPTAALAGVAGGVLGALLGCGLRGALPPRRIARLATIGSFAILVGLGVNAAVKELPQATATFELTETAPEPEREALATITLDPPDAAENANWFYILAWQGGEERIVDRLEALGDGVYRSTEPIPLHGTWKSGLRLQSGRARGAVPIRLPSDSGIGPATGTLPTSFTDAGTAEAVLKGGQGAAAGAELRAPAGFERVFLNDSLIVLREQNGQVETWIWALAIGVIAGFYVLFLTAISVGVARSARGTPGLEHVRVDEPRDEHGGPGHLDPDQRPHVGVGPGDGVDELVGGVAAEPVVGVAGDRTDEEDDHA